MLVTTTRGRSGDCSIFSNRKRSPAASSWRTRSPWSDSHAGNSSVAAWRKSPRSSTSESTSSARGQTTTSGPAACWASVAATSAQLEPQTPSKVAACPAARLATISAKPSCRSSRPVNSRRRSGAVIAATASVMVSLTIIGPRRVCKKTNLALGGVPREDSRAEAQRREESGGLLAGAAMVQLDRPGKVQVPAGQFQPASAGNQLRCQAEKTPQLPPHAPVGDNGQNQQTQGHGNDQRSRQPPPRTFSTESHVRGRRRPDDVRKHQERDHRQEDLPREFQFAITRRMLAQRKMPSALRLRGIVPDAKSQTATTPSPHARVLRAKPFPENIMKAPAIRRMGTLSMTGRKYRGIGPAKRSIRATSPGRAHTGHIRGRRESVNTVSTSPPRPLARQVVMPSWMGISTVAVVVGWGSGLAAAMSRALGRLVRHKPTAYGRATLGAKPFRRAPK